MTTVVHAVVPSKNTNNLVALVSVNTQTHTNSQALTHAQEMKCLFTHTHTHRACVVCICCVRVSFWRDLPSAVWLSLCVRVFVNKKKRTRAITGWECICECVGKYMRGVRWCRAGATGCSGFNAASAGCWLLRQVTHARQPRANRSTGGGAVRISLARALSRSSWRRGGLGVGNRVHTVYSMCGWVGMFVVCLDTKRPAGRGGGEGLAGADRSTDT